VGLLCQVIVGAPEEVAYSLKSPVPKITVLVSSLVGFIETVCVNEFVRTLPTPIADALPKEFDALT
jgi:hypothetical protein